MTGAHLALWRAERKCYGMSMNAPHQDWTGPEPFKLRVADFEMLEKAGVFEGRHKVELIGGMLVAMNAGYRLHSVAKNRVIRLLQRALEQTGSELEALAEISVKIDDESLPQPDGAVARISVDRRYFDPQDIAVAIEVSDRSIRSDMAKKTVLYAEAGIPELWIVDLRATQLHQFWSVRDGAYQETSVGFLLGELRSATIPDLVIDGSGIL